MRLSLRLLVSWCFCLGKVRDCRVRLVSYKVVDDVPVLRFRVEVLKGE